MRQWNEMFKKYGKVFEKPKEEMLKILKIFKRRKVKKILDLGCGSGRHIIYLAKNGFKVYGIDIANEGIKITKQWLREEGLRADLKIGSIYKKLPYQDNFFDAVISTHAIQHAKIEDIRKAISELERVLKPSGLIFITFRKRKFRKFYPGLKIVEKQGQQKINYKVISTRTYVPTEGEEKGLNHYLFNRKLIRKEFKNFKINELWVTPNGRHYCLVAQLAVPWKKSGVAAKAMIKKQNNKTKNQVEAIVFRKLENGEFSFLMLKRSPERGGFWQPVTGNVKEDESFETATLREVQEELGITNIVKLIDTEYSFEFTDNGLDQFERVFGVQVSADQSVKLSSEHTEYRWVSEEEALNVYLKYPGNKEGLKRLCGKIVRD